MAPTVTVPLLTVGQLVPVLVAVPVIATPVATVTLVVPLHPIASVNVAVCDPAASPVKVLPGWLAPPSIE